MHINVQLKHEKGNTEARVLIDSRAEGLLIDKQFCKKKRDTTQKNRHTNSRWWACTHSGVWERYLESFGDRPTSARWVPRLPTITKHSWSLPDWLKATDGCLAALVSVCPHFTYLPWPHRSVMIGVYKIRASSSFRPMCSVSQSVLIFYLPDFHMFGWTQSCTIAWPPKSYIYYLFLFIGSPVPLLATYTQTMDTKCSGFHHLWLDFYLIAFRTHMDIPLAFLSLWFDMS